ncbi:TerC family protein [Caenibacillus caldisaponilyticus]|jgi:YjbE family integral membrane protein|uniref:TerC family protein n=1 Tax=Caenibacillus caldisaponilyticus TaxID=1674942 RepID=UPI0009882FAF|nr:TerC family protein [Caenibacillus caldisaponilyticus]
MDGEFIIGLLKIILINIVLSGDNAVVIALACRKLPREQQKKAVFWGSFGAIVLRVVLTFVAVELLQIPFLKIVGGLLLVWIAVNLLRGDEETDLRASSTLFGAIRTIILADFIMSLDNVVAVAGIAGNNLLLIIVGLAISIPLIIWGSQLLMKLMDRMPIIVVLGAALLGYTAGEMIVGDDILKEWVEEIGVIAEKGIPVLLAVVVVIIGEFLNYLSKKKAKEA